MFSCLKYKASKDKDQDNDERRQGGNPSKPKGIAKQLKNLALKMTGGGSSSKQTKQPKRKQTRAGAAGESDTDDRESELTQHYDHRIPSYVAQGSTSRSPSPSPAAWDHNIDITGYDSYSPSHFHSPAPYDLGFVAVPTPPRGSSHRPPPPHYSPAIAASANEPPTEWLAHVEEGITIAFRSLPTGGNDLRRIRFSRDLFDRDLAQRWWNANYDRVRELYNVKSFNGEAVIPQQVVEDEITHDPSSLLTFEQEGSAVNQPSSYEASRGGHQYYQQQFNYEQGASSSSAPPPPPRPPLTPSNSFRIDPEASREVEWVEQDEPGVFITIKKHADGTRQIRRLRFSRQQFETNDAKIWWEENKERVEAQYL